MDKIFIIILIFLTQISFAQTVPSKKAIKEFETAEKFYAKGELYKAITSVDKSLAIDSLFADAYILKANILIDLERYCEAVKLFDKAAKINNVDYVGNLFELYRCAVECGDFQNAREKLLLMKKEPNKKRFPDNLVDSLLVITDTALGLMNNRLSIDMKIIDKPVNSDISEYVTAITADEKKIFFTRSYEEEFFIGNEKVKKTVDEIAYFAERISTDNLSAWDTVYKFADLYPHLKDARGITISPDGNTMFFVGCGWQDGYGSCDIYCSYKIENNWTKPINLGDNVNTEYWESQPYMSSDGFTLFFVSNRPGGYGKSDIWYSVKDEFGKFGQAKNLGDRVNTAGDERTPFIHFDARTLYFSSNGHPGIGGMDLFKIDLKDKEDKATNLGYPINDKNDQQCFLVSPNGLTAYVSSITDNGDYDIYYFSIPEEIRPMPVICIEGNIFDAITGEKLTALVELVSTDKNSSDILLSTINTTNDGHFLICIEENTDFGITVSSNGYMIYSDNSISTKNIRGILEIGLYPLEHGKDIITRNIVFAHDSYELEPASFVELDRLVSLLKVNPEISFEIRGHTDNVGSDNYNINLSENRAKVVYDYFISKGIDPQRLSYKGFGAQQPISDNDTEEGRALNRRTEFRVLILKK